MMLKPRWQILFYLIVIFCVSEKIAFAETLPPLPIERLKRIELFYLDTIIKSAKFDSLHLNLFVGNIYGGNVNYQHLVGKRILVQLNTSVQKNHDYKSFFCENSDVDIRWLTKRFWHEISLSSLFKKRQNQKFNKVAFGYQPVWFFNNSGLFFNTNLSFVEYDDVAKNRFLLSKFDVSFNKPTGIGIINIATDNLFQTGLNDLTRPNYCTAVNLANLITKTNFYLKPALNYIFCYDDNKIGQKALNFKTNLGFTLAGLITTIDFDYNNLIPISFDTLYARLFPYIINKDLITQAQIRQFLLSWTVKLRTISFGGGYQKFKSGLDWHRQEFMPDIAEFWIVPEIVDDGYTQISFNFTNNWDFLENGFVVNYISNPKNLMPNYTISDSLIIKIKGWQLLGGINVIGERYWVSENLPAQMILIARLSYQRRLVKFFVRCDNLLNNQYEILPNKFDKGIKYYLGFELNK
ncbi:MAG: hypothetical protein N2748_03565 [candidate division WOR-3 bacterium]|nr:hypothetical protein [candidate division WOR-3 bacterium]